MPRELQTALHETFTYSRTGSLGHYQGGDANLEELNKEAKRHVSSAGVPKEKDWEQVFRNLPKMKTVKHHILHFIQIYSLLTQCFITSCL